MLTEAIGRIAEFLATLRATVATGRRRELGRDWARGPADTWAPAADHLDQLGSCSDCVFWELDPYAATRCGATRREEKAAWVSMVLREWGSCGRVAVVDGESSGHMIWAPPVHVPGGRRLRDRAGQP